MSSSAWRYTESPLARQQNYPYAAPMPLTSRPASPALVKSFRLSTQTDARPQLSATNGHGHSVKRSSKLPDILTGNLGRSRTASLPPRSRGHADTVGEDSVDSVATSSVASADPFSAHASLSTSFITYESPTMSRSSTQRQQRPSASQNSPSRTTTTRTVISTAATSPPNTTSKRRSTILNAASDALSTFSFSASFSRSRKKHGPASRRQPQPPAPMLLSEVIEISAPPPRAREDEDEERERLRDAAAQSIGVIGPGGLLDDSMSRRGSLSVHVVQMREEDEDGDGEGGEEEGEEDGGAEAGRSEDSHEQQRDITGFSSVPVSVATSALAPAANANANARPNSSSSNPTSPISSPPPPLPPSPFITPPSGGPGSFMSGSVGTGTGPSPASNRARSGSLARSLRSHSRTSSTTGMMPTSTSAPAPSSSHQQTQTQTQTLGIPAFPTTRALLQPFVQHEATFPKHYPPGSLLMYALTKQWKARFIVLTGPSPPSPPSSSSTSSPPPFSPSPSSAGSITTAPRWHHHHHPHPPGPGQSLRASSGPAVSYLHLFKSSGADERELERLEINEDSVVFVTDEEVSGRRNVVKVGGMDVGAMKRELNGEEEGRTMWLLQVVDPGEGQRWIAAIKGAVLSQRSVRAGLGVVPVNTAGGTVEPRGDLDVMLSMRAQALLPPSCASASSPHQHHHHHHHSDMGGVGGTPRPLPMTSPSHTHSNLSDHHDRDREGASTPLQSTLSRSLSSGTSSPSSLRSPNPAVSALKGLFSGRSRSPSTASVLSQGNGHGQGQGQGQTEGGAGAQEDVSFGSVGTSLLGMLRPTSPSSVSVSMSMSANMSERATSPTSSVFAPNVNAAVPPGTPTPSTPRMSGGDSSSMLLERKILPDSDRKWVDWSPEGVSGGKRYGAGAGAGVRVRGVGESGGLGLGLMNGGQQLKIIGSSPSLQPPPRRRAWTSSGTPPVRATDAGFAYVHTNGSTAESLGVRHPGGVGVGVAEPKRRPRTSISSVSSSEQQQSSPILLNGKRLSRLPQRLTPPSGLPPPAPAPGPVLHAEFGSAFRSRHPYAAEGPSSSPAPSAPSSPQSHLSELRPLSHKRASGSSVQSFSTASTNTSPPRSSVFSHRPLSSHRMSIPPPQRPAPNSALPPTPGSEDNNSANAAPSPPVAKSAPATKTTFRESFIHRAHRLSLTPPTTQPPSSSLPPRPDEPGFRSHRRSTSNNSNHLTPLYSIPASPPLIDPPYPPPNGPLPPTPSTPAPATSPPAPAPAPPPRQSTSLKRRLRMLSTPVPSSPVSPTPLDVDSFFPLPPHPISPILDASVPSTPIGEPITSDPNFLLMSSSSRPPTPPPRNPARLMPISGTMMQVPSPTASDEQGVTSLSPPPRRGSRRLTTPDKEKMELVAERTDGGAKLSSPISIMVNDDPPAVAVSVHDDDVDDEVDDIMSDTRKEDSEEAATLPTPDTDTPDTTTIMPAAPPVLRSAVSFVDVSF